MSEIYAALIGGVIGGSLTLIASLRVQKKEFKRHESRWIRNELLKVYKSAFESLYKLEESKETSLEFLAQTKMNLDILSKLCNWDLDTLELITKEVDNRNFKHVISRLKEILNEDAKLEFTL